MRRKAGHRAGMPKGRKSRAWFRSVQAKCAAIVLFAGLIICAFFWAGIAPQRYDLEVGAISHQTINASRDVIDEVTTEERRKAAAAAVQPTYHLQEGAADETMSALRQLFDELHNVQMYGLTLRSPGDTEETLRTHTYSDEEIANAQALVTGISLSRYQATTLLRTGTADFETMVNTVTIAVENAMNSSIREGQVNSAIDTIKQICGYSVQLTLMQNIVPAVLRACIKPNMVIDQETTEAAQAKAIEAVEPVVYQQGQNIIRQGDVVTASQYQMLVALGLVENTDYDLSIYLGGALLVALCMTIFMLLQMMTHRLLFHDIRRTSVVMLIFVMNMGICVVIHAVSNLYMAPVAMGAMLLTGLLGWRDSLPTGIALSALVSGLAIGGNYSNSAETVILLMIGLTGNIVSVFFLKQRPQRMRMVLCGLIVAVTNVLTMISIGWMTSVDTSNLLSNAIWSMSGAMISGVLALGMQPIFEASFNLATPSKLMELANPNQPLLRRLLIEAPGTYHHSIIVANLAEAAAEKIGANPFLCRTGAYFHDVGKLKRPLYFKENQIGENMHDSTDPYVSAAIVTAHTRDGVMLAQKHHLPPEIQDIILEHHGDTPVMFFYHKALQQADGKPVNIDDFRYDGRRPTTKEAAIVMLADTVEAAVRSMPDKTPQAIREFIHKLVKGKLDDNQLDHAPLTLHDIEQICEAFCTVLNGVFHERIEYPQVKVPVRARPAEEEKTTVATALEKSDAAQDKGETT